jgi:hypothetical protein
MIPISLLFEQKFIVVYDNDWLDALITSSHAQLYWHQHFVNNRRHYLETKVIDKQFTTKLKSGRNFILIMHQSLQ